VAGDCVAAPKTKQVGESFSVVVSDAEQSKKTCNRLGSLTICVLGRQEQESSESIGLTYSRRLHDTPVAPSVYIMDSSLFLQLDILCDKPSVVENLSFDGLIVFPMTRQTVPVTSSLAPWLSRLEW